MVLSMAIRGTGRLCTRQCYGDTRHTYENPGIKGWKRPYGQEGYLYDAWESRFRYIEKDGAYYVVSNGPDQVPGTGDDLAHKLDPRGKVDTQRGALFPATAEEVARATQTAKQRKLDKEERQQYLEWARRKGIGP